MHNQKDLSTKMEIYKGTNITVSAMSYNSEYMLNKYFESVGIAQITGESYTDSGEEISSRGKGIITMDGLRNKFISKLILCLAYTLK